MKQRVDKLKVNEALDSLNVSDEIKDGFRSLFCLYNVGEYIFPSVFKRLIRVHDDILKLAVQHFIDAGIIKPYIQYYCPTCGMQTGSYHELCDVDDEEEYYCECCDTELIKSLNNVYIVYKCM